VRIVGNLIGQGIASLAGPTINRAADSFGGAATNAGITVEAQLNADLTQRIKQVDDIIGKQFDQTDEVLTNQLPQLDKVLSEKLGQFDVIGVKQVSNLGGTITNIVRYGFILLAISGIVIALTLFISNLVKNKKLSYIDTIPVGGAAVLTLAVVLVSNWREIRPDSFAPRDETPAKLSQSYRDAVKLGDLNRARYYAVQLSTLQIDESYAFMADFADLQRDLIARPALFKTVKGSLELITRMNRLEASWALYKDKLDKNFASLDYEVPAARAVVK
jgi:hypothetical protein